MVIVLVPIGLAALLTTGTLLAFFYFATWKGQQLELKIRALFNRRLARPKCVSTASANPVVTISTISTPGNEEAPNNDEQHFGDFVDDAGNDGPFPMTFHPCPVPIPPLPPPAYDEAVVQQQQHQQQTPLSPHASLPNATTSTSAHHSPPESPPLPPPPYSTQTCPTTQQQKENDVLGKVERNSRDEQY